MLSLFLLNVFYEMNADNIPSKGKATFKRDVNIRLGPSLTSTISGKYHSGETVNYDSKLKSEGMTWISWISDSGVRHYSVAIYSDGTVYVTATAQNSDDKKTLPKSGKAYFLTTVNVRTGASLSATKVAYYDPGMSVNYDSTVKAEGATWLSWLNDKGERHYCVAIDSSGNWLVSVDSPSSGGSSTKLPKSGTVWFTRTVNVRTGPSFDAEKVAYYDPDMSVNYDSTVVVDGRTWLSWLNDKGERHYCVAIDTDGTMYVTTKKPSYTPDAGTVIGGLPIPVYYQWNYRDYKYGPGTISSMGCGPTSFAMIAQYLTGKTVTPPMAISWCGSTYVGSGGTDYGYFAAAANHFGCGPVTQTSSNSACYDALKANRPVISNQGAGSLFCSQGHYIVLRGLDKDGKVLVNDPNDRDYKNINNRHFSFYNQITGYNRMYFLFPAKKKN